MGRERTFNLRDGTTVTYRIDDFVRERTIKSPCGAEYTSKRFMRPVLLEVFQTQMSGEAPE